MPKIDFNIPLLKANGEPETVAKLNHKKLKPGQQGQMMAEVVLDEEGFVIQETVTLGNTLQRMLNSVTEEETKLTFPERAKIAKLARKVGDNSGASLKNYSADEIEMIQAKTAKIASSEVIGQIDELLGSEAA